LCLQKNILLSSLYKSREEKKIHNYNKLITIEHLFGNVIF